jgi:hypothetical protein
MITDVKDFDIFYPYHIPKLQQLSPDNILQTAGRATIAY